MNVYKIQLISQRAKVIDVLNGCYVNFPIFFVFNSYFYPPSISLRVRICNHVFLCQIFGIKYKTLAHAFLDGAYPISSHVFAKNLRYIVMSRNLYVVYSLPEIFAAVDYNA